MKAGTIVIGKRVSVGAAIYAISEALQIFFPEQAAAIGQLAIPTVAVVQIFLANRYGITQ